MLSKHPTIRENESMRNPRFFLGKIERLAGGDAKMERIALDTLSLMSDGSWLHQFVNSSGQEVGSIAKHRDPNCLEVWKLLLAEEPFAKQELLLFRTTVNPNIEEGQLIRVRAGSRPPDFVLLEGVNTSEVGH